MLHVKRGSERRLLYFHELRENICPLDDAHGVTTDHYPRGSHAAAFDVLTPLTPGTQRNIAKQTRDIYDYFKTIVAEGRSLSPARVEEVARGRVWTGAEAREAGLVDALGGLEDAVAYAKEAHTTSGEVEVEHWPEAGSYADLLRSGLGPKHPDDGAESVPQRFWRALTESHLTEKPHYMLTMDETTAIELIMKRA